MVRAHNHETRRLVLIDDDAGFCKIMTNFARSRGIHLEAYPSLQEMGSLGRLSDYAVAIVDYDLGSMNGIEIAEYLPVFFGDMPMVLVSGKTRGRGPEEKNWPKSIRQFVHKDYGPDLILDAALGLLEGSLASTANDAYRLSS